MAQSVTGSSIKSYLPGYDGTVSLGPLMWLVFKLLIVLYLVASALMGFDAKRLSTIWTIVRIIVAILILIKIPAISISALIFAFVILIYHHFIERSKYPRDIT